MAKLAFYSLEFSEEGDSESDVQEEGFLGVPTEPAPVGEQGMQDCTGEAGGL
jgi:hypothetical protein